MKYSLLLLLVVLIGCGKSGIEVNKTNNNDFDITYLFTNDGCKVYRFSDSWYYHYYVNCGDSVESRVSAGKSSRAELTPTVYTKDSL